MEGVYLILASVCVGIATGKLSAAFATFFIIISLASIHNHEAALNFLGSINNKLAKLIKEEDK